MARARGIEDEVQSETGRAGVISLCLSSPMAVCPFDVNLNFKYRRVLALMREARATGECPRRRILPVLDRTSTNGKNWLSMGCRQVEVSTRTEFNLVALNS